MRGGVLAVALLAFAFVAVSGTGEVATAGATESIYLTVAYCPTDFTSAGAVVKVDPVSGAWSIVGKFNWPDEIGGAGCIILDDPTMWFDQPSGMLYLDYTEDFGYVVTVDVKEAKVVSSFMPQADFFPGYINMYSTPSSLQGVTMTVSEDGFCSDGCLGYGTINLKSQTYSAGQLIPFKAGMDDTHYLDSVNQKFYLQASYPLESQWSCSQTDSDECLIALNAQSGAIASSQYTNWTVYKYSQQADAHGSLLAFVEGFDGVCNDPYNNFGFATVNLPTATATLINCISANTTIDEEEWDSSFSADDSMMATGSGDAEAGEAQVIVFDTKTGLASLNTRLTGLAIALGAAEGLFDVWDVNFS